MIAANPFLSKTASVANPFLNPQKSTAFDSNPLANKVIVETPKPVAVAAPMEKTSMSIDNSNPPAPTGGLFGSAPAFTPQGSLFSAPPPTQNVFNTQGSLFGNAPA